MPIAPSGARPSPVTEVRICSLALKMATAMVVSSSTVMGCRFTWIVNFSGMRDLRYEAGREIGIQGNRGRTTGKVIGEKTGSRQGGGDSQTLVSGCEKYGGIGGRPDEGQL